MVGILVKVLVGVLLFVGSVVGGLAATGRLDHEGVANIPLLNRLFPAPPPAPADGGRDVVDARGAADAAAAIEDAAHAGPAGASADAADAGLQGEGKPHRRKVGRSLFEETPPEAGGQGGEQAKAEGADQAKEGRPEAGAGEAPVAADAQPAKHPAERDFDAADAARAADRRNTYVPGGLFTFEGLPAGLTPEQINEAWRRVESVVAELDRRRTALDLREQELKELGDDIARRQRDLSRERTEVENLHRQLDRRIEKFQEQVKLVRSDEVAALKKNAAALANFEPTVAAQIVEDQWKTDAGQTEILKLLEFMQKDKLDEVLKALPTALAWDVMQKRVRVSKEAAPSAPGR